MITKTENLKKLMINRNIKVTKAHNKITKLTFELYENWKSKIKLIQNIQILIVYKNTKTALTENVIFILIS